MIASTKNIKKLLTCVYYMSKNTSAFGNYFRSSISFNFLFCVIAEMKGQGSHFSTLPMIVVLSLPFFLTTPCLIESCTVAQDRKARQDIISWQCPPQAKCQIWPQRHKEHSGYLQWWMHWDGIGSICRQKNQWGIPILGWHQCNKYTTPQHVMEIA